jgi:hypothetical protein
MSEVTFQDIKKAYVTKTVATSINLCYSGKEVFVKPLRMKDKKEFLKCIEQENDDLLDVLIDNIIERYVSNSEGDPIDAKSLVDQERHQVLMQIRKISTQQEIVKIDHVCPKCKVLNNNVLFPLANINIIHYSGDADKPISVKNDEITFTPKLLTRGEDIDVEKFIAEKKPTTNIEKEFIRLASTVKEIQLSIDDVVRTYKPTLAERVEFVESLSFDDFEKIRLYFVNMGLFGMQLKFDFKCVSCGHASNSEAKIINFFIK